MREIKFRAWEPVNKEMHYLDLALCDYKNGACRLVLPLKKQGISYTMMNLDAVDVMQYTGLLDKNGKEIYEGDIIKVTGEFAIDDYGIVKWSQQEDDYTYHCGFMVDWQEEVKRRSHLSFWANHREIEIIGNIYENPELLKEASV